MNTISYTNILAQYVLNNDVLLDFGDRQKFTALDIGKGTLHAQDTKAKLAEENSRNEIINNREQPLDIYLE